MSALRPSLVTLPFPPFPSFLPVLVYFRLVLSALRRIVRGITIHHGGHQREDARRGRRV